MVPALIWQKGFVWQLVTYMFLHGGFLHMLLNMFALWMFGSEIERLWGTRPFLTYYFFTGIGAGLHDCVLTPHAVRARRSGASGAIYGLLLAYALLLPRPAHPALLPLPDSCARLRPRSSARSSCSLRSPSAAARSPTWPTWAGSSSAGSTCRAAVRAAGAGASAAGDDARRCG